MKYLFLIATFLCVFKINSFARKPAVEPVLGISIEEYKEVEPKKAKGYDFNRTPSSDNKNVINKNTSKNTNTISNIQKPQELKPEPSSMQEHQKDGSQILLYFLLTLPILASLVAYFRMSSPSAIENKEEDIDNVVEIDTKKADENIKKAS